MRSEVSLGIYEKALVSPREDTDGEWRAFMSQVPACGFAFVDLSVDESPERAARLQWTPSQRRTVQADARAEGVLIGGLCLSLHRAIGPGSADPATRHRARTVMEEGIRLCHDLQIPVLQVAGYYCYYEPAHPDAETWYHEMLEDAVPLASRLGVVLGIENVDGTDVTSVTKVMEHVEAIDSPYLQAYPDLGNIAEQGLDVATELATGRGHMVAMHAKDVRRGEPRRVGMGSGIVDWETSFATLANQGWSGRLMLEMWNDDSPESARRCVAARHFLESALTKAHITVI